MSNRYSSKKTWVIACSTGGITTLAIIVLYHVVQSYFLSQRAAFQIQETGKAVQSLYRRTLSFDVCNGMSNQRLSLLYGIILAYELGRAVVIPNLVLSGMQTTTALQLAEGNNSAPFSLLYDTNAFIKSMAAADVEVIDRKQAPPQDLYTKVDISHFDDPVEELGKNYKTTNHLSIGCPLFRLHPYYFSGANYRLIWSVLNSFKMSPMVSKQVNQIVRKLQSGSASHRFNYLHLRMEKDWVDHCKRWEHIPDGKIRNNCINNTETIDKVLRIMNFDIRDPVYVATFWQEVSPQMYSTVMPRLKAAGYKIVTSKDFKQITSDREINAMIDYEVAMKASKFLGNSVSTFSALAIYQRRYNGQWASYYNTGNIPMSEFIPVEVLPWVFVYSSYTPQSDYLIRAAVQSSLRYKTLQAFCVFLGDTTSGIYEWLQNHGVMMLKHELSWKSELLDMIHPGGRINSNLSAMYPNDESLLTKFMCLDLPLLPELDMYTFVLFTEPDVFFHRKVSAQTFSLPLPNTVGFPADVSEPSGIDSGIMLLNLPALRASHADLKVFVLSSKFWGTFGRSGFGAPGALLSFYQSDLKKSTLPSHFAAKPYHNYDTGAYLVHFKDVKPVDYQMYYDTLKCSDKSKCASAFKKGLCPYVKRWYSLLNETDHDVGLTLWYACIAMYAPHLQGLFLGQTGGKTL